MVEPKVRKDGKCAGCGKPKIRARKAKGPDGTRMERQLWLMHVDADPWCSRECVEDFYGISEKPIVQECANPACKETFTRDRFQSRRRYCSKKCCEQYRKAAKFPPKAGRCSGCGGGYEAVTKGCGQCWDRQRARKRREDPVLLERERAYWREARRKRRERKKLAEAA